MTWQGSAREPEVTSGILPQEGAQRLVFLEPLAVWFAVQCPAAEFSSCKPSASST